MVVIAGGLVIAFFIIVSLVGLLRLLATRIGIIAAAVAAIIGYHATVAAHPDWYAMPAAAADERLATITTGTTTGPVEPAIPPIQSKTRVDAATAAYDEAVNSYVAQQNKAALLEATEAKTKIKARLTGAAVKHSLEVQAAYDAKDIAEAKMNAAESIMSAAIADMAGKK